MPICILGIILTSAVAMSACSVANSSDTSAKEAKATVPLTVSITADVLDDLQLPSVGSDVLHEPIHID
ncbi:MAG: hypothetical protein IKI21_10145 [Oscillospiraceae bacterium]|nr:hypothetical protein [Oscillospiraceae bacterium]